MIPDLEPQELVDRRERFGSFEVIRTRPPASVSSNFQSMTAFLRFIAGTPGGTRSWMSIGASKFPSENREAMWAR